MALSNRVKPRNMPRYRLVKTCADSRPAALRAQDTLILLGFIFAMVVSILGTFPSSDPRTIVDNVANEDVARMAARAEQQATNKLLDMLESQDDDQPLWYDTADEPPPPPPPFWFNSRPLDVDEEGLPVERPLEVVPNMARALKWSENREIDWEGPGVPAEIDLGLNSNLPSVVGLGLIFDAPPALPVPTATIGMDMPSASMEIVPDHGDDSYVDDSSSDDSSRSSDSYGSDDVDSDYYYDNNNNNSDNYTDNSDSNDNDNDASPALLGLGINLGATFNAALASLGSFLGDTFVAPSANAGLGTNTDDDDTATWGLTHDVHVDANYEPELDELEWTSHLDMSAFASPLRYNARPSEVDNVDYDGAYNDAVLAPPAPSLRAHKELPDVSDFTPAPWYG